MSNPNFSYDIYSGLDAEVDAAYAQNIANGTAEQSEQAVAKAALGDVITYDPGAEALAHIEPDFLDVAEIAQNNSTALFERIGVKVPSLEELGTAGVNFESLAGSYKWLTDYGQLAPRLIIAPVLTYEQWAKLFDEISDDRDNDLSPYRGLDVHDIVKTHWDNLQESERSVIVNGQLWQVANIEAAAQPLHLKTNSWGEYGSDNCSILTKNDPSIVEGTGLKPEHINPTMASYLTLQLHNVRLGAWQIDGRNTYSWLDGTLESKNPEAIVSLLAPVGRFSERGRVAIAFGNAFTRHATIGTRLSAWGNE